MLTAFGVLGALARAPSALLEFGHFLHAGSVYGN
jgi:hypothetical protein